MERTAIVKSNARISLPAVRFDRNEIAGAFGDLGTDFPLLVGVALVAGLDGTSVMVMFGLMQILTGLRYRIPMPVQPLKAVAAIVIAQRVSAGILYGGGLAIGIVMLILSISGLIDWLARIVPKSVIRGIQFGLGLQLASLALKQYVQSDGLPGYVLAGISFAIALFLLGNRKYPAAIFIVGIGLIYALSFQVPAVSIISQGIGFRLPKVHIPQPQDILTGFLLLALPQIPLSLGNSILATRQIAEDLYQRPLTVRQISLTYALMNLINPFFGGVPTCHGSGGMAGHYTFGARTGGSVIIEGSLYLVMGLFFGRAFDAVVKIFPLPILGVILFFEGLALMRLVRDMTSSASDWTIVLLVGLLAVGLPYGYLIGMIAGIAVDQLMKRRLVTLDA